MALGPDGRSSIRAGAVGRPTPGSAPDILDHVDDAPTIEGIHDVVVQPVGFLSDHMEVMFDLDEEAKLKAQDSFGMNLVRAGTAGTPPPVRGDDGRPDPSSASTARPRPARASANIPASHDVCPVNCCLPSARPPQRP